MMRHDFYWLRRGHGLFQTKVALIWTEDFIWEIVSHPVINTTVLYLVLYIILYESDQTNKQTDMQYRHLP